MFWDASVSLMVSINYDNIEADSKEEAEQIARDMALEDIDYNNCDADLDEPMVSCWCVDESEGKDAGI